MWTVQVSHKHKYLAAWRHFLPFAATRVHYLFFTPPWFSSDLFIQPSNTSLLILVSKQWPNLLVSSSVTWEMQRGPSPWGTCSWCSRIPCPTLSAPKLRFLPWAHTISCASKNPKSKQNLQEWKNWARSSEESKSKCQNSHSPFLLMSFPTFRPKFQLQNLMTT